MATSKLILESSGLDSQARVENPNYVCHIYQQGSGLNNQRSIRLPLPEDFNFSIATQYSQPWAQGFSKSAFMQTLNQVGTLTGLGVGVTQSQTIQVWQGTSEVNFSLTFELAADKDSYTEIIQPIKDLLWLTLPGTTNIDGKGFLVPPGPSLDINNVAEWLDAKKAFKNEITLQIGQFIRFDSVVIESVNHVFDAHFSSSGLPLSARVDVSFKTFLAPVKDNIDALFFSSNVSGGRDRGTRGGA